MLPIRIPAPPRRRCPRARCDARAAGRAGAAAAAAALPSLSRLHLGQTPPGRAKTHNISLSTPARCCFHQRFPTKSPRLSPVKDLPRRSLPHPQRALDFGGTQDGTEKLALTRSVPENRGSPVTLLELKNQRVLGSFSRRKVRLFGGERCRGKGWWYPRACTGGDAQSCQAPLEGKQT